MCQILQLTHQYLLFVIILSEFAPSVHNSPDFRLAQNYVLQPAILYLETDS